MGWLAGWGGGAQERFSERENFHLTPPHRQHKFTHRLTAAAKVPAAPPSRALALWSLPRVQYVEALQHQPGLVGVLGQRWRCCAEEGVPITQPQPALPLLPLPLALALRLLHLIEPVTHGERVRGDDADAKLDLNPWRVCRGRHAGSGGMWKRKIPWIRFGQERKTADTSCTKTVSGTSWSPRLLCREGRAAPAVPLHAHR